MAQKVVKVKAHKRLDGNGKVESVDAHLRTIHGKLKTLVDSRSKMSIMSKAMIDNSKEVIALANQYKAIERANSRVDYYNDNSNVKTISDAIEIVYPKPKYKLLG